MRKCDEISCLKRKQRVRYGEVEREREREKANKRTERQERRR